MTTHSILSPSSRHRWARCPGSVRESAKYPKPPSGPAAIDGTHTHTLLEHCLKTMTHPNSILVGTQMEDHEGTFTVDRGRLARVAVAVNYVWSRVFAEGSTETSILSEQRVDPKYLLGLDGMAGTCDIQVHGSDGVLELIDYKDGLAPVESKGNEQLEQYGYGVLSQFKLPINAEYPFHTLRMTIIQPKLALKGLPVISSHDVSIKEFLFDSKITIQAHKALQPDAPLVPGEVQCKYCPAKGGCAALTGEALATAGVALVDHKMDLTALADHNPNELSDKQLQDILDAAPLLRQMIEGVEAEAQRRLQEGGTVPGYKLVYGRGTRAWAYSEAEMVEKLTKLGIPKGSLYRETLVSPTQVEKLVWTKRDGTESKLSDNQLKLLERDYITKNRGKITLVPSTDPREAITLDASDMFKPVETETLPEWLCLTSSC